MRSAAEGMKYTKLQGKSSKSPCILCSAAAYYCGAVALALSLPSLGVSSLDSGRLFDERPFFYPVSNVLLPKFGMLETPH